MTKSLGRPRPPDHELTTEGAVDLGPSWKGPEISPEDSGVDACGMENIVMDLSSLACLRLSLGGSLLRTGLFSGSADIVIMGSQLSGVVTWSTTTGPGKSVSPRPTFGDGCLLLFFSSCLDACRLGASSRSRRVCESLLDACPRCQPHRVRKVWTPLRCCICYTEQNIRQEHLHPPFVASSTAALGFTKVERNFLGGWAAQQSDRYTGVAKLKTSSLPPALV